MQTDQWRVVSKQYSCPVVMRGSEQDGDLEIVAKCYGIEGHSADEIASLVAAAPELLASLKRVLDHHYLNCDYDALSQAEEVIAKVEGVHRDIT